MKLLKRNDLMINVQQNIKKIIIYTDKQTYDFKPMIIVMYNLYYNFELI